MLRQGVNEQNVRQGSRFTHAEHALQGEGFVGLVDDEELVGIVLNQPAQERVVADLPRGIVRVAKPYDVGVGGQTPGGVKPRHRVTMEPAGVGIFAERGHPHRAATAAKRLCHEIDCLGGAIGETYASAIHPIKGSQGGLQRERLRLGIAAQTRQAFRKPPEKGFVVDARIYV